MQSKIPLLALILALLLIAAGLVLASGNVELPYWVLGSGATDSSAEGVALHGTLGQPLVGASSSSGGEVTLGHGFWHGSGISEYEIYLPLAVGEYSQP